MITGIKRFAISLDERPGIVVSRIMTLGATVLPKVIDPQDAEYLAREAGAYDYEIQPTHYGVRKVRQDVASVDVFPNTLLGQFTEDLAAAITSYFKPEMFASALDFNHCNIQRYEDASHGIDQHRDQVHNKNLVVLCGLSGVGRFRTYQELQGPVTFERDIEPGVLMLMKAPGFLSKTECPVHGVDNIRGRRYILALRQNAKKE
jgi:hypothetical protein